MNTELNGPFFIDGKQFSRTELIDTALSVSTNPKQPQWKKALFHFIVKLFGDESHVLQRTSGTTGDPKTVRLRKSGMINSAAMTNEHFGLKAGDSALLCLPVEYIAGKMMVVRAFLGGMDLVTIEPSSNPVTDLRKKISFAAMVPMQVEKILASGNGIAGISKLIIGGGEINHTLRERLKEIEETEIFETFAMSETYSHFAVRNLNGPGRTNRFVVVGNTRIEADSRGCLVVDLKGITDGPVQTNDLVKLHGTSEFDWLGRVDNLINSGGIKIIPEVLEKQFSSLIGFPVVLIGKKDPKLGQKLVMLVETGEAGPPIEEWFTRINEQFSKHEVPKEVVTIEHFPRTASRKIRRGELIKRFR